MNDYLELYYSSEPAEHVHAYEFVPGGIQIDWRVQGWRIVRYCAGCDCYEAVTVAFND